MNSDEVKAANAYNRFSRRSQRGIWKDFLHVCVEITRRLYLIDSTIVKAHRAAGGRKRSGRHVGKWFCDTGMINRRTSSTAIDFLRGTFSRDGRALCGTMVRV